MARKSAKLFFVACGRQAAKKSWNFLRWGSYCHCAEHESVNLIVCLSAVSCLVHTARPSGVVVSERVDHARMQTQMRAHRLFGEVDQRVDQGWIKVDQGGSEVDQAHFLVPGLREPLENVGNSERPRVLHPGETVPL